jgi:hypothetical protein
MELPMKLVINLLALATLGLAPLVGSAQEPAAQGRVELELNKLEQVEGACRIYMVVRNGATAYESFKLDVVLFDAAGVIASRVAVGMGPLRAERPTVKLFDVQDQACDAIGMLLVNEVLECQPAAVASDCLARIEVNSRTDVQILW